MAARKSTKDEMVYAINDHDTVVLLDKDDFEKRFKPAGYRLLKDDEHAPVQMHELTDVQGNVIRDADEALVFRKKIARPNDPDDDE